jgi:hypothetical protein
MLLRESPWFFFFFVKFCQVFMCIPTSMRLVRSGGDAGRDAGHNETLEFLLRKNSRLKNGRDAVFQQRKG